MDESGNVQMGRHRVLVVQIGNERFLTDVGIRSKSLRMRTHQLTDREAERLLPDCLTGTLTTVNTDGTPHNVPVHYAFSHIYIHGLPDRKSKIKKGTPTKPCGTNTAYAGIVIRGASQLVEDMNVKKFRSIFKGNCSH